MANNDSIEGDIRTGYMNLANMIVLVACEDYKNAILKGYREYDKFKNAGYSKEVLDAIWEQHRQGQLKPLENFFRSDWCYLLSDINGELMIKKIREKAKKIYDSKKKSGKGYNYVR